MKESKILSNNYSKLIVKQNVAGEEKVLLKITSDSKTPVISSEDITVVLVPNP